MSWLHQPNWTLLAALVREGWKASESQEMTVSPENPIW